MRNKACYRILILSLPAILSMLTFTGCGDQYARLLKKQGYQVISPPRSSFGTGTIIKFSHGREIYVSAPSECFPGLEQKIIANDIVLSEHKQMKGLKFGVGAKYLPIDPSHVKAAFGYERLDRVDVTFGKTTGNDLTIFAFTEYLTKNVVNRRCLDYLKDKENIVVIGAARVQNMKFSFHGERSIHVAFDKSDIEQTLEGTGLEYRNIVSNGFTIAEPMFIAMKSAHFRDLGIALPEANGADVKLERGTFKLEPGSQPADRRPGSGSQPARNVPQSSPIMIEVLELLEEFPVEEMNIRRDPIYKGTSEPISFVAVLSQYAKDPTNRFDITLGIFLENDNTGLAEFARPRYRQASPFIHLNAAQIEQMRKLLPDMRGKIIFLASLTERKDIGLGKMKLRFSVTDNLTQYTDEKVIDITLK